MRKWTEKHIKKSVSKREEPMEKYDWKLLQELVDLQL